MEYNTQQRGSVVIYSLIVSTVTLMVSLTLLSVFLPKIKSIRNAVDSVTAVYAADSAVETCIYEARTGAVGNNTLYRSSPGEWNLFEGYTGEFGSIVPEVSEALATITSLSFTGSDTTDVTTGCSVLGTGNYKFKTTGTFRGVTRSIEITTE